MLAKIKKEREAKTPILASGQICLESFGAREACDRVSGLRPEVLVPFWFRRLKTIWIEINLPFPLHTGLKKNTKHHFVQNLKMLGVII